MSVSLPPGELADIHQLALALFHTQPVTACQVMSFLDKANFCASGHSQLQRLCCVIQSDMLTVITLLPTCFLLSTFHFQLYVNWKLSHLQQNAVHLQLPIPDVVIATDAMPTHWAFYFQGSGLPLSVSGSLSGSMCRINNAL